MLYNNNPPLMAEMQRNRGGLSYIYVRLVHQLTIATARRLFASVLSALEFFVITV